MSKIGLFYVPVLLLLTCGAIAQPMTPDFSANTTTGCAGLTVQFKDLSTGNPKYWNWDFGNGSLSTVQNPVATYNTPGTYTVTLVVRNADGTIGITKDNYIVVSAAPSAVFSSNITTGCAPVAVQFTDASSSPTGSITSWQWDFGDGTTSIDRNPSKTYTTTGFFDVTLTVTSNTGCKATASFPRHIRIVSGIKPEFTVGKAGTCQPPYPVTFTNQTSGPGNMTYQWDLGNGNTATTTDASSTYPSSGSFNVTLTATSDYGCTAQIVKAVPLNGPTTGIIAPDTVCQSQKVWFRNDGSLVPDKVTWDFGNGETSINQNDSTVYWAAGAYTVKVVNTYASCVDSAIKNIYVRSSPDVDFIVDNSLSCQAPLTVGVRDNSPAPIVDWKWDFGDGGTGVGKTTTHTYQAPGQYNVGITFTDNKGCEGRITKPAIVQILRPTVDIAALPDGGCVPFTYTPTPNVNAVDGVATWFWEFGDGGTSNLPNPSHQYTTTGIFAVKLTITTNTGCTESVTKAGAVYVGTPPTVNFSMSANDVCPSETVQFTDLTTPPAQLNRWEWAFGDGGTANEQNPQHKFADTGTFQVTLKAYNNGCPATSAPQNIHIKPGIAKFSHKLVCGQNRVEFTNESIVDPALGVTYLWEFGNPVIGTNNTDVNPIFDFPTLGEYDVKLTVTNGSCTDVFVTKVKVIREVPRFTISTPLCRNAPVTLTALNDPANIKAYNWSLDGAPFGNSDQDTIVSFTTNGAHTIRFQIVDINDCVYYKDSTINIVGPLAALTANNPGGCKNAQVVFTDASTPGATAINKWTFNFGDGQTQTFTAPPFTHVYRDTGDYRVHLTVNDAMGCVDTVTMADTIFIGQLRAWFGAERDTICPTSAIQFVDSSQGKNLSHTWYFGDGGTSTLQNPTHVYNGAETSYDVKLVINDRGGCTDSITRNRVITTLKPIAAFTAIDTTTICPPIETQFTFKGAYYDSLYWDFGDGGSSALVNPTHFYNRYGDFEAKLYVVGYGGCLDSATHMVHLYNPGTNTTWNYSPLDACNQLTVDFNLTIPPDTKFTFFFGDGTVDTTQALTFSHFYNSPAIYRPGMQLYDAQQCVVGLSGPLEVKVIGAEPLFGVDKKRFCDSGVVYFTNYTIGNDPVVNRVWNFGDGSATSADENPVHQYEDPGTYLASQTVTTQNGCEKTISDTIRVFRTPDPIIAGDSIFCINEPIMLKGSLAVPDTLMTWAWDAERGGQFTTQDIRLQYGETGTYLVKMKATTLQGCADSTSKSIYIPPAPIVNVDAQPTIPVQGSVTMPVSYGENIAKYTWTPEKALSCADCPTPIANPKLTTTYNIKVTDIYGCVAAKDITVTVLCTNLNYWLPNTFSPNGDGNNDVFAPRGNGLTRINNMRIFNRWGELVWEKMNFLANDRTPTGGWDGTYKGKPAPADVYVYIIEFVCENAAIVPVKGNVALIR